MSIESIRKRLEAATPADGTVPTDRAAWELYVSFLSDIPTLLKVAEAAKVIDDAMPAAYGIMKMWVVVEYMEDLRAALTELEAQE